MAAKQLESLEKRFTSTFHNHSYLIFIIIPQYEAKKLRYLTKL